MLVLGDRPRQDIVATLAASLRFRTWTTILVRTLFVDDLRDRGPWLVFAPTDAAFDELPAGMLDRLMASAAIDELVDLAEYHIVRSAAPSHPSSLMRRIGVSGRAARAAAQEPCSNGVIVAVDCVGIPPSVRRLRLSAAQGDPSARGAVAR